uniref:ARAD1C35464p n=1 Tax=Blastobotrys adeninivorans TaxID=409370 RepID=A0A060T2T7_BLAAD
MPISLKDAHELTAFHEKHIGPIPENALPTLLYGQGGNCADSHQEAVERYPDGTIRTLTDEQIAFFRASELRQLKRNENKKKYKPLTVEETRPAEPLKWQPDYSMFGDYGNHIKNLDHKMDQIFTTRCRNLKVQNYFPAAPLT